MREKRLIYLDDALAICQRIYEERIAMRDYVGDTVAWNIGNEIKALQTVNAAVFPCKVGDAVYMANHYGDIKRGVIESIHMNNVGKKPWVFSAYFCDFNGSPDVAGDFASAQKYLHIEDFGITAFFTPESATDAEQKEGRAQ